MRTLILLLILLLPASTIHPAEKPIAPDEADDDASDDDSDGQSTNPNKRKPRKGKKRARKAAAVDEDKRVPEAVKGNPAAAEKWKETRTQLKEDLNEIYNNNPDKTASKVGRIGQAVSLFETLSNMGMNPQEASLMIKGMAQSRDKDTAYGHVASTLHKATAAGYDNAKAASEVEKMVRSSSNADAISKALDAWVKKIEPPKEEAHKPGEKKAEPPAETANPPPSPRQ